MLHWLLIMFLLMLIVDPTTGYLQLPTHKTLFTKKSQVYNSKHHRLFSKTSNTIIPNKGKVYLLGAGPGDPDLLTVQAVKLLQSADLVVSDRLVSKEILSLITCPLKVANKRPGCADEAQDEINRWVIDACNEGKNVIRLKIGDPLLFGRGGEEILEYRKHSIESTVLPGLSSSYTAPLAALVPITHRGVANQVLITTGYGQNATEVELPEFHGDRTLVLLMAVGRMKEISTELLEKRHFPASIPVCIIENATTPKQRVFKTPLIDVQACIETNQIKPPAVIVIGDVVNVL